MSRTKLSGSVITGLVLLVMSAVYILEALKLPRGTAALPDMGYVPFFLGTITLLLSILLVVSEFLAQSKKEATPEETADDDEKQEITYKRPLILVAVLFVFIFILETLGFIISTSVLLFVSFRAFGFRTWKYSLIVAVLTSVGTYFVFSSLLGVVLPSGIFF